MINVAIKRIAVAECLPRRLTYKVPEGTTVETLIDLLAEEYGAGLRASLLRDGEIAEGVLIMRNGLSLLQSELGLRSVLRDGDEIFFSIMVYGG